MVKSRISKGAVVFDSYNQVVIDRFITHQCLSRRFKLENETGYSEIKSVRDKIRNEIARPILQQCLDSSKNYILRVLMSIMATADTKISREMLKSEKYSLMLDGPELSWIDMSRIGVVAYHKAMSIMREALPLIDKLLTEYSYLDYMSLPVLVSLCPGKELYCRYKEGALLDLNFEDETDKADKADVKKIGDVSDFNFALLSSRLPYFFTSPDIDVVIKNDLKDKSKEDWEESELRLAVKFGEAPVNIDLAMNYFLGSIMECLSRRHSTLVNIPGLRQFENSKFYKTYDTNGKVFQRDNQIEGALIGLWAWDLRRIEGATEEQAFQEICYPKSKGEIKSSNYEIKEDVVDKHYRIIDKQIRPDKNKIEPSFRRMDEVITGQTNFRIGLRFF